MTKALYSIESEKSVIGAMLLSPKAIREVAPIVRSEMFATESYRLMFDSIMRLVSKGQGVDITVVEADLQARNLLEDAGGRINILGCCEIVVTPTHAKTYAEAVRDHWVLRQLDMLGAKAQNLVRTEADLVEIFASLRKDLDFAQSATKRDGFELWEIDLTKNRRAIPSAFHSLNQNAEHGEALVRGQIVAYGAREGKGKSTTLLTESAHLKARGFNVLYYSLTDLNETDILMRMMRQRTGWSKRADNPGLAEEWDIVHSELTDKFAEGSLTIMTGKVHGRTIDEIEAQIRAHHSVSKIDAFVLDYWQRIRVPGKGTEKEKLDISSERLAVLAEDLDAVGLVGGQVTVTENDAIFKGSRNLQEDAATCVFLHPIKGERDNLRAEVIKMRYGNSYWDFKLEFDKQRMKMVDRGEME